MAQMVMVVDDNTDDIEITRMALKKAGGCIKFAAARSGEDALTMLRSSAELPSLILLDLKMAGMSGIDVLHRVRFDERLKGVPVVVVTNSALDSDRSAALDAGADGFLHKNFDLDQFVMDIKDQLKRWIKY
jgi:CheY-like chemotaxis protein